jgi:PKD repeat protein
VFFQVTGTGSSQHLTVQWNKIRFFSGGTAGDTLTFQAQLYLDGRIQLNYQDLVSGAAAGNNGASATVGLKNAGTQGPDRLVLAFNNGPNAFVGTGQSTLISPPNPTPDLFAVDLTAGERTTVAVTGQTPTNLNIALLDSGGVVLATGVGGSTNLANVISGFNPATTGTYYVRVTGASNIPYDLVVTRGAGFDTEANDSFAAAQSISGSHGALGAISATGIYIASAVSPTFENISGTGTVISGLTGADDGSVSIPVGFSFPFYGVNNTTVFVSSNGVLTFGGAFTTFTNTDMTTSPTQAAIAPFWDDLHTGGGVAGSNVFFQVSGTGLDQHLTVQWNNIRFFSGGTTGDTLTFQAQLYVDGRIQFNYLDLVSAGAGGNNGASATVGVKAAGTQGPNRLVLAFNNGPNAFVGTGLSTLISQPPGDDWYKIDVTGGNPINLSTSTPSDGPGEFVNVLAPGIELYDPAGVLVASGTTLVDGRNQAIAGYVPLGTGEYRVRVMGRDSTKGEYALGADFVPEVGALVLSATSIDENGSVTLTGAFTDPDGLDTHHVVINWGDGSAPTTIDLAAGVYSFTATWQYLDDNPTGTASDSYTIGVTVSDNQIGSGSNSAGMTVNNVAPVVAPISGPSPSPGVRGQTLAFSSSYTDVGTLDTHEVSWDFGDGTVIPFHPATDPGALSPTHVFTAAGTYIVTLTVRDDDTGSTAVTKSVPITVYGMEDDPFIPGATDLVVGGGDGDDVIRFHPVGTNGDVGLILNGVTLGVFHPTGRLIAYGQGGNDDIQVASSINLMAWLYGNTGNDRLKGGSGPSMLMGGSGNDNVNGGSGRGLLIGGTGADRVIGGSGDDLLIGGSTTHDENDAALFGIISEWASSRDYATRVANIRGTGSGTRLNGFCFLTSGGSSPTVLDDGEADVLTGASGQDWFFLDVGDSITDERSSELIG